MTVATFKQPDSTTDDPVTQAGDVDGAIAVGARIIDCFACHEQAVPDLTIRVDAGALTDGDGWIDVAAQSTGAIAAPNANPRHDIVYVDIADGTVDVATGTENAVPVDPDIPAGKIPVGRLRATVGMLAITNSKLDDLRALPTPRSIASQAEAEAATDNLKAMTPLRVAQAVAAFNGVLANDQKIRSTDATAAGGPTQTLDRASASPAAGDVIGVWAASGRDSGGGTDVYAQVQAEIVDATATSEDGLWNWLTKIAGSLSSRMKLGLGLYMAGATGGDQGTGTINATGLFVNGVAVQAPAMVLIETKTVSNQATIDFTTGITGTYDEYVLSVKNVKPATDDAQLWLRVSEDAGSTWKSGASDYGYAVAAAVDDASGSNGGNAGAAQMVLTRIGTGNGVSNVTAELPVSGDIHIFAPANATSSKGFNWRLSYLTAAGALYVISGGGQYKGTTNAINGLRLLCSTGNISAVVSLYGIAKV